MCLKRIEIQGFKSFQEKVVLDFDKQLNMIVGPNGSGKSNIIDAVRWVLGEHNPRILRGDKMEEIIFSGSQSKKAVGMAEVSLLLDNSLQLFPLQYNEIQVTRRLFRSGESEYFINKVRCRQKDIRDLFLDTGLGRESYSIIGQGKIEEILNSDPEDRRAILEEAVSVAKYRQRKEEALKKLEETQSSLVRLQDILQDLQERQETLQEQAQKTGTYNQLLAKVTGYEKTVLLNDLARLEKEMVNAAARRQELERQLQELRQDYEAVSSAWHRQKENNELLGGSIARQQQICFALQTDCDRLQAQLEMQAERKNTVTERRRTVQTEIGRQEKRCLLLERQQTETQSQLNELEQQLTATEQKIAAAARQLAELGERLQQDEKNQREQQNSEMQVVQAWENIKSETVRTRQNLRQTITELEQLRGACSQKQTDLTKLQSTKKELEQRAEQQSGLLADYHNKSQRIGNLRQRANICLQKQQEQRQLSQNEENSLQLKSKMLQEMSHNYEGFQRGAREVMLAAQRRRLTGIIGPVADLLEVAPQYEKAIETALGGSLQNIVTQTDNAAQEAIEYLKKGQYGRVTFLPLNTIRPNLWQLNNSQRSFPGFLGLAAELVSAASPYQSVVNYLLGRIVVFRDLTGARQFARQNNYQMKIVTLDGEIIQSGGAITGGETAKKSASLMARSRQISELEQALADVRKNTVQQQAKEQHWRQRLQGIQQMEAANRQQTGQSEQQLAVLQEQLQKTGKAIAVLEAETGYLQQDIKVKQEAATVGTKALQELVQRGEVYSRLVQEQKLGQVINDTEHEELRQRSVQLQQQLTAAQIAQAAGQQQRQHWTENLERVRTELTEVRQQTVQLQAEAAQAQLALEQLAAERLAAEQETAEQRQRVQQAQEQLQQQQQQKIRQDQETRRNEEQLQRLQAETEQKREAGSKIELRLAKVEAKWEAGLAVLQEQYQMIWSEVEEIPPLSDKTALNQQITAIKSQIKELGSINPAAIEEYQELLHRLEFLQQQQSDLQQGKESLYAVISELDQTIAERFCQGFELINNCFKETFSKLFGGGRAELLLTDREQVLQSGVEIIVQPPGKKLQNMSLLSGGEKALTAIALLFAILQTRPSPFCILDEIEASLDDANVNKFAAYLTEFSGSMPFLVISHRKGTIQQAKVLYGVTMDQQGVSKVISLQLEDSAKYYEAS